ncbi:UDP-N-acetylglucosamine 2-epimerase [Hamadaea sp. NPDC051192]|uniref:UDP-N-acetyl glucosamine 2-epimerase n=1 Tax=Hamadaea sp. NPDC051192 TaxID=3154940 RepID=UPI0034409845
MAGIAHDVTLFIGARPNLPKAATLVRAFAAPPLRDAGAGLRVVHTGQHAAGRMGLSYADTLGIRVEEVLRAPDADRDGERLSSLVAVIDRYLARSGDPDLAVVVGDVNSTLAAAVVAARNGIPVAHVEAGLRSHVRDEPEELNRRMITAVADFHLAPSRRAVGNLLRENISGERIWLVGNAHTESFLLGADERRAAADPVDLGLEPGSYVLLSVHKASTMQHQTWLEELVHKLAGQERVVWVLHPGCHKLLTLAAPHLLAVDGVRYLDPLPYHDFGRLLTSAACVVTDSAGMQEETTVSGVACVTVGVDTARPETVSHGTNAFAGFDVGLALAATDQAVRGPRRPAQVPEHWDTSVSTRISEVLAGILADSAAARQNASLTHQ